MNYNAKRSDIESTYFTSSHYKQCLSEILDAKLEQANLATDSDLNTVWQCGKKNYVKIEKLQSVDLS